MADNNVGAIFRGVPSERIDAFFVSMILSNVTMPHTSEALSPIVFTEFMARNQIITMTPLVVYEAANQFWRRYVQEMGLDLITMAAQQGYGRIHEPGTGWNKLVSWLLKLEKVKEITIPLYQMHYIAHICYQFYRDTEKDGPDEAAVERMFFNDIVSPMFYDPLIPTGYVLLPVLDYLDCRFRDRIPILLGKIDGFILRHKANYDHILLDKQYSEYLQREAETCMTGIVKDKYKGDNVWKEHLASYLAKSTMMHGDLKMCELYPAMDQSAAMQCVKLFHLSDKIRNKFRSGSYDGDPMSAIDDMLDIRVKQTTTSKTPKKKVKDDPK